MSYNGKTIWLIGASAGIGEALAIQLAEQGETLILSARNAQKLQQLADQLSGADHSALPCDVTDETSIQNVWDTFADRLPDMVIYNAGAYDPMSAKEWDTDKAMQMVDVNLLGAMRVLRHVVPAFVKRNAGHIVLVGSVAGYRGLPKAIGYGASKAAVNHLAENLAIDLSDTNIKTQLVSPGFVKTRLTDKNDFDMPFLITAEQAASYIVKGMQLDRFEIHFPKKFTLLMKLLSLLPSPLYMWLAKKL